MIKRIQDLDSKTSLSVFNYTRHPSLSRYAQLVSRSADGWLYLSLIPLCIVMMPPRRAAVLLALYVIGFAIERSVYYFLKNTFRRQRPYRAIRGFRASIPAADEFSLPSGHTSAAFFFTTFLYLGFGPAFLPLYGWAAAVGFSRMILGVHFFSDVAIGAAIGTTIALLIL